MVKPFLEHIAQKILDKGNADRLTVVLPSKRSIVFLKHYLSKYISEPIWLPKIYSIEDFITELSGLQTIDNLSLQFRLYEIFDVNRPDNNDDNFESNLKEFYQNIGFYKRNFFNGLIGDDIESIVHKRIQINNNIFSKNYSFFVTNFLLFIDILSYNYFLKNPSKTVDYHTELENFIREIIVEILISKNKKSDYEKTLINLLESSFRTENNKNYQSEFLKIDDIAEIERNYLITSELRRIN